MVPIYARGSLLYIMLNKMRYMLNSDILGGMGLLSTFFPRGQGGGGCKMSTLVHSRGEGVKIGQNLVHVVVECPQIKSPLFLQIFTVSQSLKDNC